jgi:hypothetical protein
VRFAAFLLIPEGWYDNQKMFAIGWQAALIAVQWAVHFPLIQNILLTGQF